RGLATVCQISYDRTARVAITPYGPIRLTLDWNLRSLPTRSFVFAREEGLVILPHEVILELKFLFSMPSIFKHLVEEFGLNPIRFSKYRLAAGSLGFTSESNATYRPACQRDRTLCLSS